MGHLIVIQLITYLLKIIKMWKIVLIINFMGVVWAIKKRISRYFWLSNIDFVLKNEIIWRFDAAMGHITTAIPTHLFYFIPCSVLWPNLADFYILRLVKLLVFFYKPLKPFRSFRDNAKFIF